MKHFCLILCLLTETTLFQVSTPLFLRVSSDCKRIEFISTAQRDIYNILSVHVKLISSYGQKGVTGTILASGLITEYDQSFFRDFKGEALEFEAYLLSKKGNVKEVFPFGTVTIDFRDCFCSD